MPGRRNNRGAPVQVYPPDQFKALFAPLSRQGCADKSLVTLGVTTVTSGP